jgi:tRNA A37 methylthiotransferase MiaB
MKVQQRIAKELADAQVGRVLRVLSESETVARGPWDAPDIDGRVYLDRPVTPGEFLNVKVTKAQVYDLVATPI